MPVNRPQPLEQLLDNGQFRQLCHHSQVLRILQRHFVAFCDTHGLRLCRVANYRNGILVIEVGSAAWRQRLQLLRSLLLTEMRAQLPQLASLEVVQNPAIAKARADALVPGNSPPQTKKLSQATASHLEALADKAPPGLREKLRRLAALAGEK